MVEQPNKPGRIDRLLYGSPITVGGRTIQAVARAGGWYGGSQTEEGGGAGAWLRVTPVEVIVREPDGREQRIPTPDVTGQALRGIWTTGLLTAGVCLAIMAIRRLFA
jgi:hypothetical protein